MTWAAIFSPGEILKRRGLFGNDVPLNPRPLATSNAQYTCFSDNWSYLLADPADLPVIEVAFLNGPESPTIETAEADFDVPVVQMRGYHDFGVPLQEPRGGSWQ